MSTSKNAQNVSIFSWACLASALLICWFLAQSNNHTQTKVSPQLSTKKHTHIEKLAYQSVVQAPIHFSINTPVNGIIQKMAIPFGHLVQKNDTIATISSEETKKQFNESLIHFLKSKEQLQTAQKKHEQNEKLYAAGIISQEEHNQSNNLYNNQKVEFLQTQNALKVYCHYFNINFTKIASMDFSQTDNIQALLEEPRYITLKAPGEGILLNPTYLEKKSESSSFNTGSKVDANTALAVIGQPGHFNIEISIPETDINRIKESLAVILHPLSSPNVSIHGQVTHVDRYNIKPGNRDDIAYFPVHITAICENKECPLQSGMSAEVEIILQEHSGLHIPISAVHHQNNQDVVIIENIKSGLQTQKVIKVISTDADGLITDLELQPGEEVVPHYPMP